MLPWVMSSKPVRCSNVTQVDETMMSVPNIAGRINCSSNAVPILSPSCYPPASLCFFCHSSGVKHLGVQACMAAISAFNAELTSRCRASVFFFSNCEETMMALKAWPQPPSGPHQLDGSQRSVLPCTRQILDSGILRLELLFQGILH